MILMVKLDIVMHKLRDPQEGLIELTTAQLDAVRQYAQSQGKEDLRGFHWSMKRGDEGVWDYYDALRAFYK